MKAYQYFRKSHPKSPVKKEKKQESYPYKGGRVELNPNKDSWDWKGYYQGVEVCWGSEKTKTLAKKSCEDSLTYQLYEIKKREKELQ